MSNTHIGKFFPHECAPIVFFHGGLIAKESLWWASPRCHCPMGPHHLRKLWSVCFPKCQWPKGPRREGKLWSECFPSVNALRGLVTKGNYEVSVSQVSMPRGASSPRENMKWVFPKCRCPEGPRRQEKLCVECWWSDCCLKGALLLREKNIVWRKSFSLQEKQWNWCMCFPSVDAPRGLVAKGNYEVSVSQVSMPRRQGKLRSECFPSVNAPRGLVAKENYELSVSQLSMPEGPLRLGKLWSECFPSVDARGASSPRETMKCVFPKCRCPDGPCRQGKLCSECLLSDWCLGGALSLREKKSHYKWS